MFGLGSPKEFDMDKRTLLAASAAAFFAVGAAISAASAQVSVKCDGVNSCKGTSACKTASSSCKGHNSCKGLGWSQVSTATECVAKGGTVL